MVNWKGIHLSGLKILPLGITTALLYVFLLIFKFPVFSASSCLKKSGLAENYFQHITRISFEEARNNTGNLKELVARIPAVTSTDRKR